MTTIPLRSIGAVVVLVVAVTALLLPSPPVGASEAAVGLGRAEPFAVLAGTTVTNTGPTVVSGDLGVSPGTAMTGWPPGIDTNGTPHSADAAAAGAQDDLGTAWVNAGGRATTTTVSADLGGQTLVGGVYTAPAVLALNGTVTLDAAHVADTVWIFQAGSELTTGSSAVVSLINGADPCNVFWEVGSSATLGTHTTFVGTILALTSITATTGTTVEGRLLARNGAVTLDSNLITRPSCAAAVTTTTAAVTTTAPATTTTAIGTTTTTAPATTTTVAGTTTTTAPATTTTAIGTTTTTARRHHDDRGRHDHHHRTRHYQHRGGRAHHAGRYDDHSRAVHLHNPGRDGQHPGDAGNRVHHHDQPSTDDHDPAGPVDDGGRLRWGDRADDALHDRRRCARRSYRPPHAPHHHPLHRHGHDEDRADRRPAPAGRNVSPPPVFLPGRTAAPPPQRGPLNRSVQRARRPGRDRARASSSRGLATSRRCDLPALTPDHRVCLVYLGLCPVLTSERPGHRRAYERALPSGPRQPASAGAHGPCTVDLPHFAHAGRR